jgi:hypothetical protein
VYLLLITLVIFLSSPISFGYWWAHALVSVFCLFNIHKLSKYWLFWIAFIIIALFSTEPRFSLEYYLIASSLFAVSLGSQWNKIPITKKEIYFVALFAVIFLLDFFKIRLYEKGSLLMLFPFVLGYLIPLTKLNIKNPKANKQKILLYIFSSIAIILSNKRASLLAFITGLYKAFNKKHLIIITLALISGSFLIKDNPTRYFQKSIEPRLLIWQASFKGFLDKPLFGHGFGTYAINFPQYRILSDKHGGQSSQIINHGHSQVFHTLFENGLFGILLLALVMNFIYKQSKIGFYSFLVLILIDVPLKSFNQFLIFGLILNSFKIFIQARYETLILKEFKNKNLLKLSQIIVVILSAIIFYISSLGHFYYDHKDLDKAIKTDYLNSLYYFERGALNIHQDIEASKKDLEKANFLNPNLGYIQAFYAASLLGTGDLEQAQEQINSAIKQLGDNAYLYVISAFSNYDNKEVFDKHFEKAIAMKPEINLLLKQHDISSDEFISSKRSNLRVMNYYRRGSRLYLPLPYLED